MLITISTLIVLLIAAGLWYRKQARVHIPLMLSAFVLDVLLVLYIEITRHAIETVGTEITAPTHNDLLVFHVIVSLLTLLLYVGLTWSGIKLYRGDHGKRNLHRNMAAAFILCRLSNYVTSFWVVS